MNETLHLLRPIERDGTRHPITMDEALALQAPGAFSHARAQLQDGEIHEKPSNGSYPAPALDVFEETRRPERVRGFALRVADLDSPQGFESVD